MAFELHASDLNLTDGNPYSLESFEDAGPAPVARLGQTSPDQHGITDLGYRLQPRTFVAKVLFQDGETLFGDDHRDLLFDTLRPSRLIELRVVRDDGEERILECHTLSIEIDLLPENYPARLNRATITLRAANPTWYTATIKSPTYAGTSSWWTGDGAIGTANVMERVNYPTQGQAWTYAGTITGAWSIAFRSGSVPLPGAGTAVLFHAGTGAIGTAVSSKDARFYGVSGLYWIAGNGFAFNAPSTSFPAGTNNIFLVHNATNLSTYIGTGGIDQQTIADYDISGTARRWRSDRLFSTVTMWPDPVPMAAVYDIALSAGQRTALNSAMSFVGTAAMTGTVTAVNEGDLYAFPTITLRGPIANPKLTNLATNDVIDLTGISVPAGQTYTLDLSGGDKSLTNLNGSSVLGSMGTPTQLAGWGLAPAPTAAGGTNLIRVQAGSMTTDTLITVSFYDQHMSF